MTTTSTPVFGSLKRKPSVPSCQSITRARAVSRECLLELVRVVDDDHVAAFAGRLAADGGRDPVAGGGVLVAALPVDVALQLKLRPALLVPGRADQVAASDRVALGQAGAVARGQEAQVRARTSTTRPATSPTRRATSCAGAGR